ncbi:MAG: phage Gp37/Gp68 family protein, partial [Alphaproteobacteria bacterium]|nr:phage Gp37/Gp68 family protein [Alphaproteobacteria bacterium]
DQCARTSAVFHFKQHGEWAPDDVGEPHAGHRTVVIEDGSPEGQVMFRLGTKNTGRLLDGVVHDARPHVAS